MSTTASGAVSQPQKRPLEDPSSDGDPNDQPEAKRQALHKEGVPTLLLPSRVSCDVKFS